MCACACLFVCDCLQICYQQCERTGRNHNKSKRLKNRIWSTKGTVCVFLERRPGTSAGSCYDDISSTIDSLFTTSNFYFGRKPCTKVCKVVDTHTKTLIDSLMLFVSMCMSCFFSLDSLAIVTKLLVTDVTVTFLNIFI